MGSIRTFSLAVMFSTFLALSLVGCIVKAKQQAKVVLPPPPAPRAQEPPPRPQPLSIPQTQTQLPQPQPISPEALATVQSPPQTPETQPNSGTNSRPGRRAGPVAGPRPESAVAAGAVPGQSTAAAAPIPAPAIVTPDAEQPRATVQEIVPPAELKKLQESVGARQLEIHKVLEAAQARQLTREQKGLEARIRSFLMQSEDAAKRNDWRQANILAERALVLAKELTGADQ